MLENFRLRVFRAVARQLSFRKAAEALYITQPAVTLQIKTLEEEIGAKLFERSASGVRLTAAGDALLGYAERLHQIAAEAESEISRLNGTTVGEVILGASTTIAQYVLPGSLAEFARHYPDVRLRVHSQNTEHTAEGVSSGSFHFGMIEGPPQRRDLKVQKWFDDELLLVVPEQHEWAGLAVIDAAHLERVPLIVRERGSGTRHVVDDCLGKAGVHLDALHLAMELDSTEAILACVEEGLGVGFVSEWALVKRDASRTLATLRLKNAPIRRSFSFIWPQGAQVSGVPGILQRFLSDRTPAIRTANLK